MILSENSPRLPSLSALRAFEAAARRLSFARAAQDLHVTPAALSFQIRRLEEELGLKLFHRAHRAVTLTEAGSGLAAACSEGFAAFHRGMRGLERFRAGARLVVTAGPSFTSKWLAPRLYDFAAAHPDVDLIMSASLRLMDFAVDDIDVAIRFGRAAPEGVYSEVLLRERLIPLCAPEMLPKLKKPEDLLRAPLIHDDSTADVYPGLRWEAWLGAAGVDAHPRRSGPRFSNADHAIEAAARGGGVLLGRSCLTRVEMAQGRLAAPFDLAIEPGVDFRFLCRMDAREQPFVAGFRDWLKSEIASVPDPFAGFSLAQAAI